MKKKEKGLWFAHLSVMLFGLSGVFADLINQTATVVTAGRSLLGAILLGAFLLIGKGINRPSTRSAGILLISGVLLSLHWIAFYKGIKVSSISIGVVAVSTFPVMTAIVEPIVYRQKWSWSMLIDPLLVLIGTIVLLGFSPVKSELNGMLYGFLAAAIYVVIHLMNKGQVSKLNGYEVSFYQLLIAGLILFPLMIDGIDMQHTDFNKDLLLISLLALLCTAIAYSLFIESMRDLKARTVAVLSGLEPVYAGSISILFLDEKFSWRLVIGAAIIILSVIRSSLRAQDSGPEEQDMNEILNQHLASS